MPDVPSSTVLQIRVIPRARRNEICGYRDQRLLVRTTAAPVDGEANDSVRKLVADHLGVHVRAVQIVSGHRSRDKVLTIEG